MFNLILYDFKKRLKSPLTWILVWLILMMPYIKIEDIKAERLNRPFSGTYNTWSANLDIRNYGDEYWLGYVNEKTKEKRLEIAKKIVEADAKGDYKNYNKNNAFSLLISAKEYMSSTDVIQFKAAEKKIKEIWDNVSDGTKYEDISIYHAGDRFPLMGFSCINHAKFHNYLYNNDLDVYYNDDINNISFLYNYLIDILPILLIIFPILLIYNSINKEINNESIKLSLTQGLPRWKYYMAKYISGVLHILLLVYIPLIFVSVIIGFKYGFVSLKYPVSYYPLGFKSLIPRHNFVEGLNYPNIYIGISRLPRQSIRGVETILLGDEIIPFYKFILLSILFTILFVLFVVALVELISSLINNEQMGFIITALIFSLGYKLSQPYIHERHYNLSPFTMNNSAAIINGSCNVTALTSFIILSLSTIILLSTGIIYFKKKDI